MLNIERMWSKHIICEIISKTEKLSKCNKIIEWNENIFLDQ